jgi:hypothetical protein
MSHRDPRMPPTAKARYADEWMPGKRLDRLSRPVSLRGAPAFSVQPFDAVKQETESELQLELLVAATADAGEVAFRR